MILEMATFPVDDVRLGSLTEYNGGVLVINEEELTTLVLDDKRIASADLAVV